MAKNMGEPPEIIVIRREVKIAVLFAQELFPYTLRVMG
jgi:hypothetical protein